MPCWRVSSIMTTLEFKKLLDRYEAGKCTEEEIRLIDAWYDKMGGQDEDTASLSAALEKRLWQNIKPTQKLHNTYQFALRIAASVAVLAVVLTGVWRISADDEIPGAQADRNDLPRSNGSVHFTNLESVSQKVSLRDGSSVILEPGSSITYPSDFDADKRVVYLSGEGFFDVSRDVSRPFIVYSNEIITKVLGTSFSIKAYDSGKEIIVSVKTGTVSVSPNPQKQKNRVPDLRNVILTPNQQVIFNRDTEIVSKQLVPQPAIVKEKTDLFTMQFDGKPVTEIFDILESSYGIAIQYDADVLRGCVLTTKMSEEGFYERINIICKAINAEYSTTDAVIHINSRGCK